MCTRRAWHYRIVEEGSERNTTKWNILPGGGFTFCEGETPRDDIKFLNQVIDELSGNSASTRGMIQDGHFSNGGWPDDGAGRRKCPTVAAGGSSAGRLTATTLPTPQRLLPNLFQIGNGRCTPPARLRQLAGADELSISSSRFPPPIRTMAHVKTMLEPGNNTTSATRTASFGWTPRACRATRTMPPIRPDHRCCLSQWQEFP